MSCGPLRKRRSTSSGPGQREDAGAVLCGASQEPAAQSQWASASALTDRGAPVDTDERKVDKAVLGLLYLGLHDGYRAWKSFDWDAMGRLHEQGMITDPVGKAKSVLFTEDGLREAERAYRELFTR
jgi:hypothetical protein